MKSTISNVKKSKTDARKRAKVAMSKKGGSPRKFKISKICPTYDILAASGLKLSVHRRLKMESGLKYNYGEVKLLAQVTYKRSR